MRKSIAWAILTGPALLASSTTFAAPVDLDADTVKFLNISTVFPALFDENTTSVPTGTDRLVIGLDNFTAKAQSTVAEPVSFVTALDTFLVTIEAKPGWYIKSVKYFEEGRIDSDALTAGDFVMAAYTGSWTVGTEGRQIPTIYAPDDQEDSYWSYSGTVSLTGQPTLVQVNVTNSLSAVAAGSIGTYASIMKMPVLPDDGKNLGAYIQVETALIPLPASVWLLGTALFGVSMFGRRVSRRRENG